MTLPHTLTYVSSMLLIKSASLHSGLYLAQWTHERAFAFDDICMLLSDFGSWDDWMKSAEVLICWFGVCSLFHVSSHAFISTLRGITALEFSFVWHLTTDECHLAVLNLWLWLYRNSISKMLAWVDLDNRQIHCFSLWRATHQWAKLLRPLIFLCCQPEKHRLQMISK